MEKQIDLTGKTVDDRESLDDEQVGILKSTLQKSIRRANVKKAMYFALKLAEQNWCSCWRRLSVIADEDVGQPLEIVAVDTLYRKFMAMKKQSKDGKLSWDAKRCVVCAAKILAESWKDRRSDEFLELMDAAERHGDKIPELKAWLDEVSTVLDEALDQHTVVGRKMGRGDLFWYEVSSETVNKTPAYEKWRKWFKPLMIEIVEAKEKLKK